MGSGDKRRVAIIGGGVGAITTAYAIASDPELRARFDITVYQLGWRLGGKGASGRDMANGGRILEHGLHVWAGFYDNAFRLLRDCYARLVTLGLRRADAPLGTIEAAFKPLSHLLMAEHFADGSSPAWRPWLIDLPSNDLVPGTASAAPSPFEMFRQMLAILVTFLKDGELGLDDRPAALATLGDTVAAVHRHAVAMPDSPLAHLPEHVGGLRNLVAGTQSMTRAHLDDSATTGDARRRMLLLADCCMAVAHGLVAGNVFEEGYDALDELEFAEWLRQNGAHEATLRSTLLRSCYDFVFGYPHGRGLAGDVGAGTAVRAMSRLVLTYRGAIFWKMQAGMGDTIFAPYYQALSALGVKFRFFNAARRLRLSPDRTRVAAVDMVEQAATTGDYQPLVEVQGLPCWPAEPDWTQLVDGERLRREGIDFESEASPPTGRAYTLEAGRDFDTLVLGASMGSLPYLTEELSAASPRWRRMIGAVKTVGTQAAQFWLTKPQDALGWRDLIERCDPGVTLPDGPLQTVITGFAEPLDTWADMSHLLDREDWGPDGPASIAYFCSPAPDGARLPEFKAMVRQWASDDLVQFWPGADTPGHGGFQADDLYVRPGAGGDPFDDQYYRVNMHGSERYVLSLTGSLYHRLPPDGSGFANLVLAGDWTRCGLNAGCVEAATMSGIAAASAVTGKAMLNVGAEDIPLDDTAEGKALYTTSSISAAPWPITGVYARGEMTGWFIFVLMPRADVEALLPAGLSLGHTRLASHGMHPVGLSFCRYHAVRGSFLPNFMAMRPYGEASFAIPFVHTADAGRAMFLYPRRLYVDSLPAIAAGRIFYAMNKSRARIDQDDSSFRAFDSAGTAFIDTRFTQHDDPAPLVDHPAFGTVASMLNLPFVTTPPLGGMLYNAFSLELDHAFAAPVSGDIAITDRQPGGFPAMTVTAAPLVRNHPHHLPGALRIWCNWSMTNPVDVRRVRETAIRQAWLKRTYAGAK